MHWKVHCSRERSPSKRHTPLNDPRKAQLSPLLSGTKIPFTARYVSPQEPRRWPWLAGSGSPVPALLAAARAPIHEAGTASYASSFLPHYPEIPGVHHFVSPALKAFLNFASLKAFYFQHGSKRRAGISPRGSSSKGVPSQAGIPQLCSGERGPPPATSS